MYSVPYILFFFFIYLCSYIEFDSRLCIKGKTLHASGITVVMLLFFLYVGCRGLIGTDWYNYYPFYYKLPEPSSLNEVFEIRNVIKEVKSSYDFEPAFIIYSYILKLFCKDYYFWQLLNTIIDFLILYKGICYFEKRYAIFALLFWVLFSGLALEINILRNMKSIYIFIYSLRFIHKRQIIHYYIAMIIAFLFHTSAILYFPFYFILGRTYNKKIILRFFVIGYVIYFLHIDWMAGILDSLVHILPPIRLRVLIHVYLHSSLYSGSWGLGLGFIERFVTFFIIYKYFDNKELPSKVRICINMIYVYLLLYLYCSEMFILIDRLAKLFICGYWLFYPYCFSKISRDNKKIGFLILLGYGTLKLLNTFDDPIYRYTFNCISPDSFQDRSVLLFQHLKH